ncbi:hypothetical protein ACFWSP_40275, partial [Streptomyces sp. NPDC058618]
GRLGRAVPPHQPPGVVALAGPPAGPPPAGRGGAGQGPRSPAALAAGPYDGVLRADGRTAVVRFVRTVSGAVPR